MEVVVKWKVSVNLRAIHIASLRTSSRASKGPHHQPNHFFRTVKLIFTHSYHLISHTSLQNSLSMTSLCTYQSCNVRVIMQYLIEKRWHFDAASNFSLGTNKCMSMKHDTQNDTHTRPTNQAFRYATNPSAFLARATALATSSCFSSSFLRAFAVSSSSVGLKLFSLNLFSG